MTTDLRERIEALADNYESRGRYTLDIRDLRDALAETATVEPEQTMDGHPEDLYREVPVEPEPDEREALKQIVLDNFHSADDKHPTWWINTDEMADAILAAGFRRSQPEPTRSVTAAEVLRDAAEAWVHPEGGYRTPPEADVRYVLTPASVHDWLLNRAEEAS